MDFTQPWDSGDVTFIVEGKKIYANKAVLSISSEVFKIMFTSEFKEKKMTEIPLPDKKFDDFLQLMQILHPQTLKSIYGCNIHGILPLAHEYQMETILKICVNLLYLMGPSILTMNLVEKYDLKRPYFHKECKNYLKDTPLSQLKAEPGFTELKPEILFEVLNSKVEKLEPLKAEVGHLANWRNKVDWQEDCLRGGYTKHKRGANKKCLLCSKYRLAEICEVLGKY